MDAKTQLLGTTLCGLFLQLCVKTISDPNTGLTQRLKLLWLLLKDGDEYCVRKVSVAHEIELQELMFLQAYTFAVRQRVDRKTGAITFYLRADVPIKPL